MGEGEDVGKRKKIELPEKLEAETDLQYFKKHYVYATTLKEYLFPDEPGAVLFVIPLSGAGSFVLRFKNDGELVTFAADGRKPRRALLNHAEKRGPFMIEPGAARFDVRKVTSFLLSFIVKNS